MYSKNQIMNDISKISKLNTSLKTDKSKNWYIVILLMISYTSTTISTNTLSSFVPSLIKEFGWTHSQISLPASLYFIYIFMVIPVVGYSLLKFKPKNIMILGSLLAFLTMILYSNMKSYSQYKLVYILFSIAISMSGLVPSMVILNNWFKKKIGLAVGIFLVGSSLGGIIYPQIARYFIENYDWRTAGLAVGIAGLLISTIPLLFVKNQPSELGKEIEEASILSSISAENQIISYSELFKSPIFYVLVFITAAFWFCGFSVLYHFIPYLKDISFDLKSATNYATLFFIFSIVGKIGFGYFSDKFNKFNILLFATICLILGLISLNLMKINPIFIYLYTIIFGIGYSGSFAMIQLTVSEIYKGKSFSKVLGVVNAFDSIGGFAGISLLGYLRTKQQSYDTALLILLCTAIAAFLFSILLKRMKINS
jgi:sugar phosphate permease